MKKLLLLLLFLGCGRLWAGESPNFRASEILVLPDGFIALRIENASAEDFPLPAASRDKVFISLAINGIKRAEYLAKTVDPALFLKHGAIVYKTNFRAGQALKIRMEVNKEKAFPENDLSDNALEIDLPPIP